MITGVMRDGLRALAKARAREFWVFWTCLFEIWDSEFRMNDGSGKGTRGFMSSWRQRQRSSWIWKITKPRMHAEWVVIGEQVFIWSVMVCAANEIEKIMCWHYVVCVVFWIERDQQSSTKISVEERPEGQWYFSQEQRDKIKRKEKYCLIFNKLLIYILFWLLFVGLRPLRTREKGRG